MRKDQKIEIRVTSKMKSDWKRKSEKQNTSLTDLIISSVENKIGNAERKEVLAFIEKQDNIFAKIENNINQFAKVANTKSEVSADELKSFNSHLEKIQGLKKKEIGIIKKIYALM